MVVDRAVAAMPTVVVGGNEVDVHLTGVVPGRDFPLDRVADLRNADAGDPCPRCGDADGGQARGSRSATSSSSAPSIPRRWGRPSSTTRGTRSRVIMGCYGIGVNRIVAAAVEAGHDDNGIVWPLPIAPYQVADRPAPGPERGRDGGGRGARDSSSRRPGSTSCSTTATSGPGVKFKDADLIGIPLRVVVGERGLKEGTIEVKWRTDADGAPRRGGDGRRGDPGRAGGDPQGGTTTGAPSAGSPAPRRGASMSRTAPCPGCPSSCSALMTVVYVRRPARHRPRPPRRAEPRLAPRPAVEWVVVRLVVIAARSSS